MNYFIEGLQGSGKSTLVTRLSEKYPELTPVREGDYSPVELAWCAYVSRDQYEKILDKYDDIRKEIEAYSYKEDNRMVICYTRIITDIPGFHKDMEQYEIYNNQVTYTDREIHICYLESRDINANIDVIRKERSDDKGNELWFPLMMRFFDGSPYAKRHGLSGEDALIDHLKQRQELELRI